MRLSSFHPGVLWLALVTAAFGQSVQKSSRPTSDQVAQLQSEVPELMQKGEVPGLQIAIIRHGRTTWTHGFGVRSVDSAKPVTNDTIFEAASLSKPVFAYAVLKLVDQGKLDLDTPLTKYLPGTYDVQNDVRINQVTARFVLSHRTGFRNWRNGQPLKIYFTPGDRFSYSGEGFVYLAKVVEHITGQPFNEFMEATVFKPLGMTSSSYLWRQDYDERTALGHDADDRVREKYKPTEVNAAASLHTTALDYARFMEAVLNGTGLKPSTRKRMLTPQVAVDPRCTNCTDRVPARHSDTVFWGLGVGLEKTKQGLAFWHWGDNGAFRCFMIAYPGKKNGVVYFTNSENGLSIAPELIKDVIGDNQPALAWVNYDTYDSPPSRFYAVAKEKGADAAIEEFQAPLQANAIPERAMNAIGYRLMGQKKFADAIKVFQLNVKRFPDSANVYDSLGEAYMNNNDKPAAIQNYQKSLQLNPGNTNATEMLKKLKE